MSNFNAGKKMNILLLKSLTCMIRIIRLMYPWKPYSRRCGPPRTRHFLIPISWHSICNAVWLLQPSVLHGVTGGPATSHGLEIWCPVYGHAVQQTWGYTLQSSVKTTAGSPLILGLNALYAQQSLWWHVQSTLRLMICVYYIRVLWYSRICAVACV